MSDPSTARKSTTLIRKLWMAITGLFLCVFLVVHLLGNIPLLFPEEQAQQLFNSYAAALAGNIFIQIASYVLYAAFIVHSIYALIITLYNRKRQPRYAYDKRGESSPWYSRSMGILGTILLLFLIIHMKDFWYTFKFGNPETDPWGHKDLYTIVVAAFHQWWYVGLYVFSMAALGYHLLHGFYSAIRTLGLYHPKYVSYAKTIGIIYSYTIAIGFSVFPVFIYVKQLL